MAICAESSNHIVVNAFLLAFYLRCIEQNGGEGGAMWVKRGKKGWAMGTNSPQKTHFVPFSGLKSDFPAPGSFQKDDILLSEFFEAD